MTEPIKPLHIFLSYAHADVDDVRKLYEYLIDKGFDVWFDEESLIPGQDWRLEIENGLYNADIVIVCLSDTSVNKEGFVQKEFTFALDRALEMPEGRIALIPVRLNNCKVPRRLSRYHWVDLFTPEGYPRLMRGLKLRAEQLTRAQVQNPQSVDIHPSPEKNLSPSFSVGKDVQGNVILGNNNVINVLSTSVEQDNAAKLEKQRADEQRIAQEQAERERIAKEKTEKERLAKLKTEQERIARQKTENERIAREKLEREAAVRQVVPIQKRERLQLKANSPVIFMLIFSVVAVVAALLIKSYSIISGMAGAVSFIIGIVVLIKLFQKGGVVQGIIGLVTFNLYTFIWGWINAEKENIGTMMWIWTGIIILSIIISVVTAGSAMGGPTDLPTTMPTQEGLLIIRTLLHV